MAKKKTAGTRGAAKPGSAARATRTAKKAPARPRRAAAGPSRAAKGPTAGEIAGEFVRLYNAGTPDREIWARWFSPDIVSVEGDGQSFKGMKGLEGKSAWWYSQNTVHGTRAEGPFVGADSFAVAFTMDVEAKQTGHRSTFREVGVYTVKNGKIVREEFLYGQH